MEGRVQMGGCLRRERTATGEEREKRWYKEMEEGESKAGEFMEEEELRNEPDAPVA